MSIRKEGTRAFKVRVKVDDIDPMYDTPELRAKYVTPQHPAHMKAQVTAHVHKILEGLPCFDFKKYLDAHLEIERIEIFFANEAEDVLIAEFCNPDREQKQQRYREMCWGFADACMNGVDPNVALHAAFTEEKTDGHS